MVYIIPLYINTWTMYLCDCYSRLVHTNITIDMWIKYYIQHDALQWLWHHQAKIIFYSFMISWKSKSSALLTKVSLQRQFLNKKTRIIFASLEIINIFIHKDRFFFCMWLKDFETAKVFIFALCMPNAIVKVLTMSWVE